MDYQYREIEQRWQKFWAANQTYRASNQSSKPKYYVLDMFPYPSGAGLHVGHPLGYIASDIFSRYKRLKGFNVLHPMGYDSFGLPAEQYAIQTGQHPAITTEANINRYREQLDNLGFSFDWSREVRTSDPDYYRWTQWIFMQLFNSWYNVSTDKAESVTQLMAHFSAKGSAGIKAVSDEDVLSFTADEWNALTEEQQQTELLKYRLAYLKESTVNWCPALGTVLANDEVKDGFSERGGHPVVQKKMMQWSMRITAYAERLLQGLESIDWPEPLKEMQRNWIGKSVGASVKFEVESLKDFIEVFTTRVDTIFGASFLVLAPEHEWVTQLTTPEQEKEVKAYIEQTQKKSELDRMADTKTVSGAFTGAYAVHPFTGNPVPIWIADYVLAGYGTGAVMGVPSGDQRDWLFAKHFDLPIVPISDAQKDLDQQADPTKEGRYINSDFINGLNYQDAVNALIFKLEQKGQGKAKVNYRLRDAIFGRQRYWGEPVPVYFKNGLPYLIDEKELPLLLPEVDKYLPTESGEPPLGRATDWKYQQQYEYELSTMPGWAGSSWYWYRYMDAQNQGVFASKEAIAYWKDVDLYIGGSEHATGHLLYSRFWNKFLKDLGVVEVEEPFKKLINQGMILGDSAFAHFIGFTLGVNKQNQLSKSEELKFENIQQKAGFLSRYSISSDLMYLIRTAYNNPKTNEEIDHTEKREKLLKFLQKPIIDELKSLGLENKVMITPFIKYYKIHVPIDYVNLKNELDFEKLKSDNQQFADLEFISNQGSFLCSREVEKMSKSKFNVVNPDDMVERYGADTLRLYEMFLGPLEQSKPWNTNGIEGVFKFLRKFWRLFHDEQLNFVVSEEAPSKAELKSLHKIIKKVEEDIDRFSFNTSVSSFMICVNELTDLKCNKRQILEPLTIVLSAYAPHITEELWSLLGHQPGSISYAAYPIFNPDHLVEDEFAYPVSVNGKMRMNLNLPLSLDLADIEAAVLANEDVQRYLEGKTPKKVIVVKGRIVNLVV